MSSIEKTLEHAENVAFKMDKLISDLKYRAIHHDESKTKDPELAIFDAYTDKLKSITYGGPEYKRLLDEMKPALDHHYAFNRHHPEHFEDGIKGMNLVDLMEMVCDWAASSERHDSGDIIKSIEFNQLRFNYSDELKQILINTVNQYSLDRKRY